MGAINRSKLPPGPKSKFPLEHLFKFRRDSIGFLRKIANEYGDVVHFTIGPIRIVLLNHPDFIKEVLTTRHQSFIKGRPLEMAKELLGNGLLTSEGDFHKAQSRIIQPAFHRNMIESFVPAMVRCVIRLMQNWQDGMQVDMKDEMTKASIDIAGTALFNADIGNETMKISKALDTATSLFGRIQLPFSEWLLKIPLPANLRFYKSKKQLDDVVNRMIEERRRSKIDNGDLISLLLRSQNGKANGGGMSDQQIRDEAITLFLTAFDTTSTALTWTWYLLSQNPEAELEMHQELDTVLKGRMPTAEDISQLKYTRNVFAESMRMYPPSYLIPREATEDFAIDKYIIPKGTIVLVSPYLVHHDPRFYSAPEKFNPQAWEKHSYGQNSKYEYFPFSRGPRSCIGEPFAWTQAIVVLASIAQLWRIKLVADHPVELLQLINLRSRYGMKMTLHRRKQSDIHQS